MTNHQLKNIKVKAVRKALALAGSQTALAAIFDKKQQNVSYWLKNGLPLKLVPIAARAFKEIPVSEFAPEIYASNDDTPTLKQS